MSRTLRLILVFLARLDYPTVAAASQCDARNSIDLQSAAYRYSLILRVHPMVAETRTVFVREVIKRPNGVAISSIIVLRLATALDPAVDESCWHLLEIGNIDSILFLNQTASDEFDLQHPPVESTLRVRQQIDAVLNYGRSTLSLSSSSSSRRAIRLLPANGIDH